VSGILKDYPIVFEIPVQWGEQDSFGHVNNVVYFRWCETARVVYLERIGMWEIHRRAGVGPILARIECNFRKPLEYPDTVRIGSRVTRTGNSSFEMEHAIVSERLGLVAEASSTIVVVDYKVGRTCPIPEEIRTAIRQLEGREL
jgi:acyl-CoA thioester hydrolase